MKIKNAEKVLSAIQEAFKNDPGSEILERLIRALNGEFPDLWWDYENINSDFTITVEKFE